MKRFVLVLAFASCVPPAGSSGSSTYGAQDTQAQRLSFSPSRVVDLMTEDVGSVQPPLFSQDGDVLAFRANGMQCGMIGTTQSGAYSTYVICAGNVLAGPLTSQDDNRRALEMIVQAATMEASAPADQQASDASFGFDLAKSVRDGFPNGGTTTTVYDASSGRPLYSKY